VHSPKGGRMARERRTLSIKDLMDAGFMQVGQELRFRRRDDLKARITSQGLVLFRGVEYRTPSGAAKAVGDTTLNGWMAWQAKSEDADWVVLADIRKQLQK
jgi:Restriction Enzyme Adenine Methylase Associated